MIGTYESVNLRLMTPIARWNITDLCIKTVDNRLFRSLGQGQSVNPRLPREVEILVVDDASH